MNLNEETRVSLWIVLVFLFNMAIQFAGIFRR